MPFYALIFVRILINKNCKISLQESYRLIIIIKHDTLSTIISSMCLLLP